MAEDLDDLTRAELRELAGERGIPRAGSMKKTELVEHLAMDEGWRGLERSALEDQARQLNIPDANELSKPELIGELHKAHSSRAQPPEPPVEEPEPLPPAATIPAPGTRPGLGRLLQLAGNFGMILSLIMAVLLPVGAWLAVPRLEARLAGISSQLLEVSELLDASSGALQGASNTLEDTSGGLATTQLTLANSQPLLDSVSDLLGSQAPETIRETRRALLGAQEGARAMDRVLRGLALLGLNYNPEVPLDESLAQTADSLEPLPGALIQVQNDIDIVQIDLKFLESDMGQVSDDLENLSDSLAPLAEKLETQSDSLKETADTVSGIGNGLRNRLLAAALIGSLIAVWVAIGQAGLVVIGGWLREGVPVRTEG